MHDRETDETRDFWNRVADDWQLQVGTGGDSNRIGVVGIRRRCERAHGAGCRLRHRVITILKM